MRAAIALCLASVALGGQAQTVTFYEEAAAFEAVTPILSTANFDAVPDQTTAPFSDGALTIGGPAGSVVASQVLGDDHAFWFDGMGSPPRFLVSNAVGTAMALEFDQPVEAIGFVYICFACDPAPDLSSLRWTLYDPAGAVVADIVEAVDFTFAPHFVGFTVDRTIRRVEVYSDGANWFLDDVRYGTITLFADGFEASIQASAGEDGDVTYAAMRR